MKKHSQHSLSILSMALALSQLGMGTAQAHEPDDRAVSGIQNPAYMAARAQVYKANPHMVQSIKEGGGAPDRHRSRLVVRRRPLPRGRARASGRAPRRR